MRTYVLDLSVLMESPGMLRKMPGDRVVIPLAVFPVLDKLKVSQKDEPAEAAKRAARELRSVSKSLTALVEGVRTEYGVTVQVVKEYAPLSGQPDNLKTRTIGTALLLQGRGHDVTILTCREQMKQDANKHSLKALVVEKEKFEEKGGENMEKIVHLKEKNEKPSVVWVYVFIASGILMLSGFFGGGAFFGLGFMGAVFSGVQTFRLIVSDFKDIEEHVNRTMTKEEIEMVMCCTEDSSSWTDTESESDPFYLHMESDN